jgi:hypothetical protein
MATVWAVYVINDTREALTPLAFGNAAPNVLGAMLPAQVRLAFGKRYHDRRRQFLCGQSCWASAARHTSLGSGAVRRARVLIKGANPIVVDPLTDHALPCGECQKRVYDLHAKVSLLAVAPYDTWDQPESGMRRRPLV